MLAVLAFLLTLTARHQKPAPSNHGLAAFTCACRGGRLEVTTPRCERSSDEAAAMKSRVIQDESEPADGNSNKEPKMEELTVPAVVLDGRPVADSPDQAVVVAREVTRRYGEGDTAVDALRGVCSTLQKESSPP